MSVIVIIKNLNKKSYERWQSMSEIQLTTAIIKRYAKLSVPKLKLKAQNIFNAWIRERDAGASCISCGSFKADQAGHFYAAGSFNHMRFLEDNCHLQCLQCNYFKHGNLIPYRINLIQKIGLERVEKLDLLAADKGIHKDDRYFFIEVCEKYKL
jgi:Bacteriophage Lambda NinG protein